MAQENVENTGQGGQTETGVGGAGNAGETPARDGASDGNKGNNNGNIKKTNYPSGGGGIVALGVYLIVFTLLSLYGFKVLMTAETPPTRIVEGKKQIYCGTDVREVEERENSNTTADQDDNTNDANQNSIANSNTNKTNVNTSNVNSNATPNVNTGANNSSGGVSRTPNVNQTGGNLNNSNAKPKPPQQTVKTDVPELTVPPFLCVKAVFSYNRIIPADGYLFLVVLFAGMLGALLRGIGSFARHLGLGDFSFQWTWFYLLLPLSGAIISLGIYLVLRGGFYGGGVGKGLVLNVFAFAALATLTGLFSENAIEKLRQVAVTLLTDVPKKVEKK